MNTTDRWLASADTALRTLFAKPRAARPMPTPAIDQPSFALSEAERQHAAGLMRVNHVGEVCAQALYSAQALMAKTEAQRELFLHAAHEETDHLAWTNTRLKELGGRPYLLNPLL